MRDETPEDVPIEVEAPAPEPAAEADPAAQAQAQIDALSREKKETYDRLLRTAADFDNYKKRARKDVEEARIKAREDVLRDILPAIDNLERALVAAQDPSAGAAAIVDGIKLVLRQFHGALDRFEVKAFDSLGQPFDPARHEAIAQVETGDHPPGTVASEMQRGYLISGRLLRPALVGVAKASPAPEPPPDEDQTGEG